MADGNSLNRSLNALNSVRRQRSSSRSFSREGPLGPSGPSGPSTLPRSSGIDAVAAGNGRTSGAVALHLALSKGEDAAETSLADHLALSSGEGAAGEVPQGVATTTRSARTRGEDWRMLTLLTRRGGEDAMTRGGEAEPCRSTLIEEELVRPPEPTEKAGTGACASEEHCRITGTEEDPASEGDPKEKAGGGCVTCVGCIIPPTGTDEAVRMPWSIGDVVGPPCETRLLTTGDPLGATTFSTGGPLGACRLVGLNWLLDAGLVLKPVMVGGVGDD